VPVGATLIPANSEMRESTLLHRRRLRLQAGPKKMLHVTHDRLPVALRQNNSAGVPKWACSALLAVRNSQRDSLPGRRKRKSGALSSIPPRWQPMMAKSARPLTLPARVASAQPFVDLDVPETQQAWKTIIKFFDKHLGRSGRQADGSKSATEKVTEVRLPSCT
jgi:hypothetical protein